MASAITSCTRRMSRRCGQAGTPASTRPPFRGKTGSLRHHGVVRKRAEREGRKQMGKRMIVLVVLAMAVVVAMASAAHAQNKPNVVNCPTGGSDYYCVG